MGRVIERYHGWEARLSRAYEKHRDLPGAFGTSDCFLWPADAVEAVTGFRIFAGSRRYRTETGAAKQLRRKGFETVADAFASLFEEIPPAQAGRGDIGVVERDGKVCGGVFTALGFVGRGVDGMITLPRAEVTRAFKVG